MRIPAPLIALGAAATIALAGCSGGSAVSPMSGANLQSVAHQVNYQLPHQTPQLSVKFITGLLGQKQIVVPNAGCGSGALVYASQYYTNDVLIYKQSGKGQTPCASITSSIVNPQGMTSDPKTHIMFIANTGASNVVETKKGGTTITKTLADSGQYPVDVCEDSNGNIYATNIITTGGGPGSVSEWVKGKGTPKNLAVPNNTKVLFCALDNKHNLYVNYISSTTGAGAMVEFVGGKGTAKTTKVTTQFPGAMQFDSTQDLVGNDQIALASCTYELPNPAGKCHTISGVTDLLGLKLTSTGKDIFLGDAGGTGVYEYTYPGYKLVNTISSGQSASSPAFGVATDPGRAL